MYCKYICWVLALCERDNRDVVVSIITGSASSDSHPHILCVITLWFCSVSFRFFSVFAFCLVGSVLFASSSCSVHLHCTNTIVVERKFFQSLLHCALFEFHSILFNATTQNEHMLMLCHVLLYAIPSTIYQFK